MACGKTNSASTRNHWSGRSVFSCSRDTGGEHNAVANLNFSASLREKWLNLTVGSENKTPWLLTHNVYFLESFRSELQRRFKGRALERIYYWGEGSVKDLLLRRGLLNTGTRPSLVDDWSRLQILYRANPKFSSLQLCNTCQIVDLKKLSIRFW